MTVNSQRGVALLTILLLVVSITIVAGAMLASQKIAIRRSGVLFDQNQMLKDINAGQQLVLTIIRADNTLNDTDSAQDVWAKPMPPYVLGTHTITAQIRDEASRFNINNLYHDGAVDAVALEVFQRLLTQLNIEPKLAIAILDWQDTDSEVYKDGGDETVVYVQQGSNNTEQTLPNQPFISVEQLQEVRGISAETVVTLRPYITAVPYYLPINMNTASPVLLAALMDSFTAEQLQTLIELRSRQPIASVEDAMQIPPLLALSTEQRKMLTPLLAVDSQAFTALITVTDNGDTGAPRQRFATVIISKVTASSTDNPESNNNGVINREAVNEGDRSANNDKNTKVIKVVSQRLWAFRPNF